MELLHLGRARRVELRAVPGPDRLHRSSLPAGGHHLSQATRAGIRLPGAPPGEPRLVLRDPDPARCRRFPRNDAEGLCGHSADARRLRPVRFGPDRRRGGVPHLAEHQGPGGRGPPVAGRRSLLQRDRARRAWGSLPPLAEALADSAAASGGQGPRRGGRASGGEPSLSGPSAREIERGDAEESIVDSRPGTRDEGKR